MSKQKSLLPWLALSLAVTCQGCQTQTEETRLHTAKPGDVLVVVEDITVTLTKAFKPGTPNGLFDGGVEISSNGPTTQKAEVNVVCSMPDLPNWPDYDNIYGRWLKKDELPGDQGGKTDWQLLLKFNSDEINKGREEAPAWAKRVAQNACRKGDFRDNKD